MAELNFMKSLEIDITGTFCGMHKGKAADVAHILRPLINNGKLRRVVIKGVYMEPLQDWPPMDPERLVYCLKRCLHLHTRRIVEIEANAQGWPSPEERGKAFRKYNIELEERYYEEDEKYGCERWYTEDEEGIEEGDEWQTESEDGR